MKADLGICRGGFPEGLLWATVLPIKRKPALEDRKKIGPLQLRPHLGEQCRYFFQ